MRNPSLERHVRIDPRARMYVHRYGPRAHGVSFDDVQMVSNALAGRLNVPTLAVADRELGTLAAYQKYRELCKRAAPVLAGDTWYHPTTASEARQALESARVCRRRVRLYYGDPSTGRDDLEVADTIGWIGRAGAPFAQPVLLASIEDRCGVPIWDNAVIRIQDLDAQGCTVYQHAGYHLPDLTVVAIMDGTAEVLIDGHTTQAFDNDDHAQRWLKFVRGLSQHPPRPSRQS
jgi:hypothetical protein